MQDFWSPSYSLLYVVLPCETRMIKARGKEIIKEREGREEEDSMVAYLCRCLIKKRSVLK